MGAPVIVPKSGEPWTQEANFRVEHWNREIAQRCVVYFSTAEQAQGFAGERTLGGAPCVVESKAMEVTHTVSKYALTDETYVFWTKNFGDYDSARAEFARGQQHAEQSGGAFRLALKSGKRIAQFEHWKD